MIFKRESNYPSLIPLHIDFVAEGHGACVHLQNRIVVVDPNLLEFGLLKPQILVDKVFWELSSHRSPQIRVFILLLLLAL